MKRVALRGLAARPVRTALTMLAIVLGVAMVSGAFTLTDTMRGAAQSLSSSAYDGTDAVVSTRTAFNVEATDWMAKRPPIGASVLEKVRAVPQVAVAVGDITDVDTKIVGRDGKPVGDGPYFGSGYDAQVKGAQTTTPYRLDSGRWPTGPGEVVIDVATAEKEHYALRSSVRVTTPGAADEYEVVGTTRFGEVKALGTATIAVFDLETAQTLFHKDGAYDSILVAGRDGVPAADVRKAVSDAVGTTAQVQTAKANDRFTLEGLEQFISIIRIVLLVFGFVAIFVGAFTIFNTLSITVAQRSREFGLLRMVGATRRQVLGSVLLEALAIGLLASAVGLAAGFGIAKGLDAIFDSMDIALPDAGMVFASRTVIVAMLVGTLVTLVAGLIPAWRATRVPPVAALRAADPGAHKLRLPARAVRGLASLIGRPAEKLGGSAGALARRNAMRHPGRTATTASALMIGVALVTLVTVIAQGLRDTTSGTLDKRIAATHVISGADGWSPTDPAVARSVSQAPGITGVTAIRQDVGLAFGDKEVVNSIDPSTAPGKFSFEYASGSEDAVAGLGRDGAIVDEGLATERRLTVGDRLTVTSAKGAKVALTVKAIEKSPVLDALGLGPITIAQGTFEQAFENHRNVITLVSADSGAAVTSALKPYPDAKSLTKSAYIDSVTADIDSLLAIFYVLLALAVIVSLFGIVNTLVLSTFERTRELGTLRAVGMTRRQIRRMVRHESVITALIGAGLGIALGLGLAAIVTSVFGDEGLTFAVPTGSLIVLTIVAGVAGVLAAIAPARRAARLDVLTALAYE
jgi:putative ABC transport system permease protein